MRRFQFRYRVDVPASSTAIDVWIPKAKTDAHQTIRSVELAAPVPHSSTTESAEGNELVFVQLPPAGETRTIELTIEVERSERRGASLVPAKDAARYLAENARVPSFGETARAIADRNSPPIERARAIFDHLLATLEYDTRGCSHARAGELGDLSSACQLRKGTCTEFHGLYVSYARTLGIPATFAFGFNVPRAASSGTIAGYHCWVEIFLPDRGWFPIDVSEASKRSSAAERDYYFGNIDENRVQFSSGRDLILSPPQRGIPLDKLIFPHAETETGEAQVEPSFSYRALE